MAPTPVLLLENPMDRGAWWAAVLGVAKSRTRLSDFIFTFHFLHVGSPLGFAPEAALRDFGLKL